MDKSVWIVPISENAWQISTVFTATFHFISQIFLNNIQSMSTKKQISSLCKFYSKYEEIPEEFLDETDVENYFYHNILDNSQSQHRVVWVSKGSNKKFFAIQSYISDLFSRKKSAFPEKKLSLYSTVWVIFLKLLIKPTKYRRFHYPNQNLRFDSQKKKTNCSVILTRV